MAQGGATHQGDRGRRRVPGRRLPPDPRDRACQPGQAVRAGRPQRPFPGHVQAVLEGQVIQPLLVGRRMQLNPMLVFLALWFGGMFWGIAGIVLAMPALVALKVIASHSRSGAPLVDFLSPHSEAEDDEKLEDADALTSIP